MEANEQPRVRYRVNVTRLAKGNFTFDCTCEFEGPMDTELPEPGLVMDAYRRTVLNESALLVAALEAKYPREAPE